MLSTVLRGGGGGGRDRGGGLILFGFVIFTMRRFVLSFTLFLVIGFFQSALA